MSRNKPKGQRQPFAHTVATLGQKRPAAVIAPSTTKTPVAGVPVTWNDEYPAWRVGLLQLVDPFGWQDLTAEKLLGIRAHLASFETMTWNQISVQGKYQHHTIPVHRIIAPAQRRLHEIGLGTVDELFRFRIGNMPRIWGLRDRHIMHVIWWDPDHLICPSNR